MSIKRETIQRMSVTGLHMHTWPLESYKLLQQPSCGMLMVINPGQCSRRPDSLLDIT